MKIGVLGSGDVAKTLGAGFARHGHQVTMGTREPAKLAEWQKDVPKATVGSFAEAAKFGEVVVLAVKGTIAAEPLRAAGAASLAGKPVIDACNPIADAPPEGGVLKFFTHPNESLMEKLQQEFPAAHFVKAFNSVGAGLMINPSLKGGPPTMFLCGNDASAKATVSEFIRQFGWEPDDRGGAEAARAIEPLCMLWCIPGFQKGDWAHAFKVIR